MLKKYSRKYDTGYNCSEWWISQDSGTQLCKTSSAVQLQWQMVKLCAPQNFKENVQFSLGNWYRHKRGNLSWDFLLPDCEDHMYAIVIIGIAVFNHLPAESVPI